MGFATLSSSYALRLLDGSVYVVVAKTGCDDAQPRLPAAGDRPVVSITSACCLTASLLKDQSVAF